MKTSTVVAVVLGLVAAGAGWAWLGERDAHRETRVALKQAEARLSAKVEPDASARPVQAAKPCQDSGSDPSGALAELSSRLTAAEEERDRYKAGLEQAVGELNRVSGRNQAATELVAALAAGMPTPSSPSRASGKVVPLADPFLTPIGDRLEVTGKLYNVGGGDAEVTCVLELLRDGQRIDSARFAARVAAGATQPYSQSFRYQPGREGSYSARLTIE